MTGLLQSRRPADWRRAFLYLGLMQKILGQPRRIPCPAGRDFLVLDPWSRLYACHIRPDLEIGDLSTQSWKELLKGSRAAEALAKVRHCTHNCWTEAIARSGLRRAGVPRLPRLSPLAWILSAQCRRWLGWSIPFDRTVDFRDVAQTPVAPRRESWLGKTFRPTFQKKTEQPYGAYNNVMNK